MSEINKKLDEIGRAFEEFKKTNDARIEAIEKNQSTAELDSKMEKIEENLNTLQTEVKERLDEIESRANRIRVPGHGEGEYTKDQQEHLDVFLKWIRNRDDRDALMEMQRKATTITTSTDATAGYALPEVISREIDKKLLDLSPMRGICKVEVVGTTDYKKLINVRGAAAAWVGEDSSRSQQDPSSLAQVAPTFGTLYSYPYTTEEALNDLFFNVQQWLIDEASEAMAKSEGEAFIDGNGTNKPTGFLDGTPEETGDEDSPARTFGELEFVKTGNASGFGTLDTGSPSHYPADCLIDLIYKLKAGYRNNARWLSNKSTLATIRKFKDSEGNYIWTPGLVAGQPDRILGYPLTEMPGMPDIGSNAFPVAFGDFRAGYLICDLVGMRITVDDNITAPGYVKFYIRKRVGGELVNDDAIKVIKCAA